MRNPVLPSVVDGLGNGLGYSLILLIVGALRESLGTGGLMGVPLVTTAAEGGWFEPLGLMQLAPSAFFILGLLVWLVRVLRPEQAERPEFRLPEPEEGQS